MRESMQARGPPFSPMEHPEVKDLIVLSNVVCVILVCDRAIFICYVGRLVMTRSFLLGACRLCAIANARA